MMYSSATFPAIQGVELDALSRHITLLSLLSLCSDVSVSPRGGKALMMLSVASS